MTDKFESLEVMLEQCCFGDTSKINHLELALEVREVIKERDQLRADLENERRKVTELVDGYEKDQAELKRLRSTIYTDNSQTVAYATKRIAELEAEVAQRTALAAPAAQKVEPDYCTDPDNCRRCKTHPNHRGDMEHAGIGRRPVAPAAQKVASKVVTEGGKWQPAAQEPVAWIDLTDKEIMEIRALKDGRPYGTFELCKAICEELRKKNAAPAAPKRRATRAEKIVRPGVYEVPAARESQECPHGKDVYNYCKECDQKVSAQFANGTQRDGI